LELNVCPLTAGLESATWRPRGTQLGHLVEERVDEAHVLSWPGLLETYTPLHDTGGYDRARTPFGQFDHRLEQIKGTGGRSPTHAGEVRISFNAPALVPDRCLSLIFVRYDLAARQLVDPAWVVPSRRLSEVCSRRRCARCRTAHWDFTANPAGLARDRAHRYQVRLADLALARWPEPPQATTKQRLALLPIESGTFFEKRFDADFLETSAGEEILLQSDPDLFGRDRLAFAKGDYRWASLAIKGSTQRVGASTNIEAQVPLSTFRAHARHFLLFQHYDRGRAALHLSSWLVPSPDFARLATRSGPHLQFSSSLQSVDNRWRPYRIPTAEAAARFRAAIHIGGR
jgi:hypothetical protein